MAEDPRPRHVHDDSCWEYESICTASDLPQHECDQGCTQVNKKCEYRADY